MTKYAKPYRLNSAPTSFEEMYKTYYPHVLQMACKAGLDPDEMQDAANHIMMKFYERDFLNLYDPERGAAFSTYLLGSVRLYLRHFYTKKNLQVKREGIYVDDLLVDIENKFPVYFESELEDMAWGRIRDYMDERCSPEELAIFEVIVQQTKEASRISYGAVSERAGISKADAKTLVDQVKYYLLDFYTAPGVSSV